MSLGRDDGLSFSLIPVHSCQCNASTPAADNSIILDDCLCADDDDDRSKFEAGDDIMSKPFKALMSKYG